jgi:DNA-binding response OmpR family regulator
MGVPGDSDVPAVTSLALQARIEALLTRHRGQPTSPSQQEINDLYTDGCAVVLALETERLRVKRRMTAAAIDSANDVKAARDAAALAQRGDELVDELASLKQLVKQLRAAVDWAQHEGPPAPPRRRFRRV